MGIKFTNNATTTLAAGVNSSATSLSVQSGAGGLFPALAGGDYFYCSLANNSGNVEIIKVTARSADTFTVVRGYDNTAAMSWNAGDKVELRVVAAGFNDINAAIAAAAPLASPALTGTPTAPTPAQFDNDTSIATTAFAQTLGLHSPGVGNYSGSVTLSTADIGRAFWYTGAGPATVTLPDAAALGLPVGSMVIVSNVVNSVLTLARAGTALIFAYGIGNVTTLTLNYGDGVSLAWDGGNWVQVGSVGRVSGDSTRTYSVAAGVATTDAVNVGQFPASLVANGYQKLASGLIIQWGAGTAVASATSTVTFPITFPNACLNVVGTPMYATSGNNCMCTLNSNTNSQAIFYMLDYTNGGLPVAPKWFAVGY
jgi:hypothetical protein